MVKMTQYTKELVAALRCISGVPTGKEDIDGLVCSYGPLVACLGCGYKHDCGIRGCAILREVERRLTIGMVAHDGGNDHAEA